MNHWLAGFFHRLSIRARTRQGQVTPESADERAVIFGIEVQQKCLNFEFIRYLTLIKLVSFHCERVLFEYLPKDTINIRSSKTVWVSHGGKAESKSNVIRKVGW
ncbi:hypothetical protein PHMEG_00015764 [Phytophthora megakarya]|uniref:Uncharacterized protein n=1 Tax=Phytophthora megakarya TaxID=4795 RepID=A0A225W1I0_9STRA|nr:hypothetical protein PHMEG_00015764 [Phytophthora megakarya]